MKEVHTPSRPVAGKPGESYPETFELLCLDMSQPPEHRVEEMLHYKLKEDERGGFGKLIGKNIEVGIHKISHGKNGTSRATVMGKIIKIG